MQKKPPKTKPDGLPVSKEFGPLSDSRELWVRPNMSLRHQTDGTGELDPLTSGSAQKFLELANIALGLGKPATARKKTRSVLATASLKKGKRSLRGN